MGLILRASPSRQRNALIQMSRSSGTAASELAGSHPDTQRRVLATLKDERGWAVREMRKSLEKAKRRMAIEGTEGRQVEPPGKGNIKIYLVADLRSPP